MTQKDKELLLKDLSARLPYGVKIQPSGSASPHKFIGYDKGLVRIDTDQRFELENIKLYLRPMSSITEEEKTELGSFVAAKMFASQNKNPLIQLTREALLGDFFNKHHFDYRGLIPIGLALEAPEGMYK